MSKKLQALAVELCDAIARGDLKQVQRVLELIDGKLDAQELHADETTPATVQES